MNETLAQNFHGPTSENNRNELILKSRKPKAHKTSKSTLNAIKKG